ncbi:molecular chaperone DnaJ [Salipiger aestuarii]|uniref:DnaJ-like protein n=1 Tax=Salipiger aestuarii TaxID=568098 RepID=A0A327Y7Q7_9RHOB|nr:DnaJ domain-containing protein [Salipiger aestuarii]EIE52052.1 DnaJ domain-containing protein [Citreicella sp. 357]KAA8608115.1 molecular chaperone DnaJ [Salipiger aestuarii]KAA8611351.1 molecular chaperone DnaJ [Salipiger aestuarii]KAB2542063.1 molecular chaperone DnaJ [Salipiger aestuarii]RAK16497.1 DnaJ-like protein [Salipiger aestuarii]
MSRSDPFGFDMSVKTSKKKNPRGRRGMTGEQETSTRLCDHEGCSEPGKFRAPKAPDVLDDWYWFCKDHVREYNARWSFFDGKTEAEMNAQQSSDKVWERKTKDYRDPEARAWARLGIEDPHQVLGDNATRNPGRNAPTGGGRRLPPTEKKALEILDVEKAQTKSDVRKAYKALIKVLHPDMNGGDRSQEEQLQEVVWAWDQIKDSRNFK